MSCEVFHASSSKITIYLVLQSNELNCIIFPSGEILSSMYKFTIICNAHKVRDDGFDKT